MSYRTFCNIYYPVTEAAKQKYESKKKQLNLDFINGGSKFASSTDQWARDNLRMDNTDDNISNLNGILNELTSIYWMWSHLDQFKEDYIGHNHYRLFFKKLPERYDKFDILVSKPIPFLVKLKTTGQIVGLSVEQAYKVCHIEYIWDVFEYVLCKNGVDKNLFIEWKKLNMLIAPCQMFLMKREKFREYCQFLFKYIFLLKDLIDLSRLEFQNAYQHRQLAFLGERILSLWTFIQYKKGCTVGQLDTEKFDDFKPFTDADERNMKI